MHVYMLVYAAYSSVSHMVKDNYSDCYRLYQLLVITQVHCNNTVDPYDKEHGFQELYISVVYPGCEGAGHRFKRTLTIYEILYHPSQPYQKFKSYLGNIGQISKLYSHLN